MCTFQDAVKIMAKDLVRTRRYVKKFIMMRANIQAVSLKVQVGCCLKGALKWKPLKMCAVIISLV